MRITELRIANFRSILELNLPLGETTVFIGQNNAGKTAIIDAMRLVLSRRWGPRGTGFTENDVHRPKPDDDPRTLPPVTITLVLEEQADAPWHADTLVDLADFTHFKGRVRRIALQVTCRWDADLETFSPSWQFLNAEDEPTDERRRSINFYSGFFNYLPLFWQGALRDADTEFSGRSGNWNAMLRAIRLPNELEAEVLKSLSELDEKILAAAPRLGEIADMIGEATKVAIGDGPGAAKVSTLPLSIEEMIQRTALVMRNENLLPWLPMGSHGQGLQSLAVIFLQQAAVQHRLLELETAGARPIFAIEEAEAHLHPHAARSLWDKLKALDGQKLLTTHSPHFLHHVPLRDIRLVRIKNGQTEVSSIPNEVASTVTWNDQVDGWVSGAASARATFRRDPATNTVSAVRWFDLDHMRRLSQCFPADTAEGRAAREAVGNLHHAARILPSVEDERDLAFHNRRIRGEIFFARRWLLVEGVCEYLLVHAISIALGWPLDDHGVSVIDYQSGDGPVACAGLGDAFEIPWHMIGDGKEKDLLKRNLLKRGFTEASLAGRLDFHEGDNHLEAQLIADGHAPLLRSLLGELGTANAEMLTDEDLLVRLRGRKTGYMGLLAPRVAGDAELAAAMPAAMVRHIKDLRDGKV